jgi:hypothetical protein
MQHQPWSILAVCVFSVVAAGCGDDASAAPEDEAAAGASNLGGMPGDAQTTPPQGTDELEAWLEKGDYKSWACETVEHPQMKVSPHGINRVCSNDLAAGFQGSVSDERPLGTASVKEIYDDASALVGYAVGVKIAAESAAGSNWYWYERVRQNVVVDGLGDTEPAKSACVGCHAGAGSDAQHAVTGSSDFVYLQVAP